MVELGVGAEVSFELIFFSRRNNTLEVKLLLRGHPCASPSLHRWKCQYVLLLVLYQNWFSYLYI